MRVDGDESRRVHLYFRLSSRDLEQSVDLSSNWSILRLPRVGRCLDC
jgi:hypothetical protein